jgi:4-hydroxy-tetrahydrodipicolinate synthase
MAGYTRAEARDWAREKLIGAVNCTIPSFTNDLRAINETAIRHDVRQAKSHGFIGTLGVSEVSITLAEYLEFLAICKDEAGPGCFVVHHASWSNLEQNLEAVTGAERAGADLVLLSYPPNFYPESEQDIYEYTKAVCSWARSKP